MGVLDEEGLAGLLDDDPDEAVELLADLARATDPALRAEARRVAGRLLVPRARHAAGPARSGAVRLVPSERTGPDLDVDATLERVAQAGTRVGVSPRWRRWERPGRAVVLALDASGSVTGAPLRAAVVTAAALAARMGPDDELAVVAFWSRAVVLRPIESPEPADRVLDALFDLRGGDTTDLAGGIRAALAEAGRSRSVRRDVVVLTDGLATAGPDPLEVAAAAPAAGTSLHVLALSDAPESVAATTTLAAAGGGRVTPLLRAGEAPAALARALADKA